MDRMYELELKKQMGTITDEESDELFELKEEEYEADLLFWERYSMYQTPYGWM